jgi:prepilin-type processing-associated H-X9-DG protein
LAASLIAEPSSCQLSYPAVTALHPDKVALLFRCIKATRKIWFADAGWFRWATGSPNLDQEAYTSNIESRDAAHTSNSNNQLPSRRHRGGSNLLFFDGHVQWVHYRNVVAATTSLPPQPCPITGETLNGSYREMWDPDGDNVITTP